MSVFLRKQNLKKGVYLSFVESNYDSSTRNSRQTVIQKIGYVDDLKEKYVDPIAFFTDKAKVLSAESSQKYAESKSKRIPRVNIEKNLGYFLPKYVYDSFQLDPVFKYISCSHKYKFNLEHIFRFLTYSQIVCPSSKQSEFKKKDQYFDNFNFSDDQLYDAIQILGKNEEVIKEFIQLRLKKMISLDTSNTYFDGTNFYFEIDKENEELKRGPEKNKRHDPIIGLGLLIDANGIPINYTTFPGNCSEQPELHKNVQDLKKKEGIIGRTIITADKGLNSGDNMYKAIQNGDGYIIGQKVRGANSDCIDWILQDDEFSPYRVLKDDEGNVTYKIKSEVDDYKVQITSPFNGQKTYVNLKQKRVVFWSKNYADKAKYERDKVIERSKQVLANPSKFLKSTIGDAATYIKEIKYDNNGEIIVHSNFELDFEAIDNASKLDGYYLIVSSEINLPDEKMIAIYRGLWEIEESFSIMKGVLKTRPFFSKTLLGIHSHILISFFSLLILRILQKVTLRKELSDQQVSEIENANKRKRVHKIRYKKIVEYPITQICDFIRNYNLLAVDDYFFVTKYSDFIPFINERFSINLDRNILYKKDIDKILSSLPQHTMKSLL